ncbi:MAG TPA: serine/threonine-protein kinase [Thermoanaerobaculia bacterium]|jgi:serine/threonine-protein kinase|nr:serine/threonine-protein kinase [Thermoanaerobaculia bacterium]
MPETTPLDPALWTRVEAAWRAAIEAPPGERAAALDAACGVDSGLRARVEELIAADADSERVIVEAVAAGARLFASGAANGRRIGPYRLEREIGRGGTSTVFLARRDGTPPDGPPVALKLLDRGGPDGREVVARFEAERRALSALDHPGIARLLEVGIAEDGRPFVVLEWVDGLPIDAWCAARGLDLAARVRLFRRACAAVHAAHQRLVVHRDLKPGNVLVAAGGAPKLLDFGLAKLLGDSGGAPLDPTATALRALTPAYASPEQVRGEPVTTATDVYSLGVLLFELATGQRPIRTEGLHPTEVERAICEQPPNFTSVRLPDDLENILRMALRKEPGRRYGSVEQLAEDLGRFLAGRPVIARKDTWAYRSGKFVRRHRWSVAAAGAFLALIVAFAVSLALQSRRLARERDRAERTAGFLVDLFEISDPSESRGASITAREMLDRGAARLSSELADEPEVRASLQETIGKVYQNLGLYRGAEPLLVESLATRRRLFPGDHPEVASSLNRLAVIHALAGDYAAAKPLFREALAMRERLFAEDDPKVIASLNNLALLLHDQGDYAAAEVLYRRGVDLDRRNGDPDGASVLNLALLLIDRGEHHAAEALIRPRLPANRARFGERHPQTSLDLDLLGQALEGQGRSKEAEALFSRALAIDRALQPGDHLDLARDLYRLGALYLDRGDLRRARPLLTRAAAIRERFLPPPHPELAAAWAQQGRLALASSDFAQADERLTRALAAFRAALPARHPSLAEALVPLAELRIRQGRCAEASALAAEAEGSLRGKLLPSDRRFLRSEAAVAAGRRCGQL